MGMNKKLYTKEQIIEKLKQKYGDNNIYIVSTEGYDLTTCPNGRNSKRDRSDWADEIVLQLYNKKRSEIERETYHFAYVKFACEEDDNIYGIVSGKSSFHIKNPSDVYFYDLDTEKKKEAAIYMKENGLRWYTKEILIVKNCNKLNRKEAYNHEREIKELFGLFD